MEQKSGTYFEYGHTWFKPQALHMVPQELPGMTPQNRARKSS